MKLTKDHLAALTRYKKRHGLVWKERLLESWLTGNYSIERSHIAHDDEAHLQHIRNNLGPKWLANEPDFPVELKYANLKMHSDVEPYEIVKIVSAKTIEIRRMKATLKPDWKMESVPGGFAAHVINNGGEWDIESDPTAPVVRARLNKGGFYKSKSGAHWLADKPIKWYDYNF